MNDESIGRLISRTEFAKLANVSPAAVTNACNNSLELATIGKRIDQDHPSAKLYLEKKTYQQIGSNNVGLDPYYAMAVDFFHQTGNKTNRSFQKQFHIGYERSRSIVATMKANNVFNYEDKTKKEAKRDPLTGNDLKASPSKAAAMESKTQEDYDGFLLSGGTEDVDVFINMTLGEIIERYGTVTRFTDWLAAAKRIEEIKTKRLSNAKAEGELINKRLVEVGVIDVFNSALLRLMSDGSKTVANGVISKHLSGVEVPEIESFVTDIIGSFIKPIKSKIERSLRNATT